MTRFISLSTYAESKYCKNGRVAQFPVSSRGDDGDLRTPGFCRVCAPPSSAPELPVPSAAMRVGAAALCQLLAALPLCHGGGWTSIRGGQYYGGPPNSNYQDASKPPGYGPPSNYPPQQYQQQQQQQQPGGRGPPQPPQQTPQGGPGGPPRGSFPPDSYGGGPPSYGGQYPANSMQLMPAGPSPTSGGTPRGHLNRKESGSTASNAKAKGRI
eukprot:scaffold1913_cov257-Pinguiococcus_pyrenoidosus.AAC.40